MTRQPEKVLVPALVGLEVADAHELAVAARVVAVGQDLDVPLPTAGHVIAQHPPAGTRLSPGDPVTVWVESDPGGGGGGGSPTDPDQPAPSDPSGAKEPT